MRRAHIWGWARTRRWAELSSDPGPSSPSRFCADYIIVTRGYDIREGQGDVELVTKKEVLDFQLPPRFEQIRDEHRKQMEDGKHRI